MWWSMQVNDSQMIDLTDDQSMTKVQLPVFFGHSAMTLTVSSPLWDVQCPMEYISYIRSLIYTQAAYLYRMLLTEEDPAYVP